MIEINYKKLFNLFVLEIAKTKFGIAFCTYADDNCYYNYKALLAFYIGNDICCFQVFGKELILWSKEGGWLERKYKNGTWRIGDD